jgi:hypothetical protein
MYKKIYDYIVSIDMEEREDYSNNIEKFINEYQNGMESYKQIGERLESLLKENKKFEELEVMENFLWNKVYNKEDK